MGRYIRKSKTTSELAVMDLSFGVRTRAKTLALQRQQRQPPPPPPPPSSLPPSPPSSFGYLQLRSRRLKKPPVLVHVTKRQKPGHSHNSSKIGLNPNFNSNFSSNSSKSSSKVRVSPPDSAGDIDDNNNYKGIEEASFGENVLDFEGRERSTRESTPCSLIRDPESIRTPGSTTRPSATETNRRLQNSTPRHIPTSHEMDEFFTGAEEQQQRRFIDKYNFDPVKDKPLPGRYEWEKMDP
ncbi:cyclin-dependent kinase inhibitor 5 [Mercurialis annua]|uniref:cyclin-dependent kinase inhibitor 5 n=1 Tax=Mercurialis annua TaxID=3986 RepID=UPI00215F33BD|nr:cyclin-dependent kinase inhibitor 5 [Mercurialis annua]